MTPAQDPFYIVKEEIQESLDELEKAVGVAAKDPSRYGINEVELEKRRRWTSTAHNQVGSVKRTVEQRKETRDSVSSNISRTRQDLMRLPNDHAQEGRSNQYQAHDNDDFISSESDRQMLLIRNMETTVKRRCGLLQLLLASRAAPNFSKVGLQLLERLTSRTCIPKSVCYQQ